MKFFKKDKKAEKRREQRRQARAEREQALLFQSKRIADTVSNAASYIHAMKSEMEIARISPRMTSVPLLWIILVVAMLFAVSAGVAIEDTFDRHRRRIEILENPPAPMMIEAPPAPAEPIPQ